MHSPLAAMPTQSTVPIWFLLTLHFNKDTILQGSNALILIIESALKICYLPNSNLPGDQHRQMSNSCCTCSHFHSGNPFCRAGTTLNSSPRPKILCMFFALIHIGGIRSLFISEDMKMKKHFFPSNQT